MNSRIVGALLIGGRGERFWPRSRRNLPKQFLPIVSPRPMLVDAWDRIEPLAARVYGIVNHEYAAATHALFAGDLGGRKKLELIEEPASRSTAPAIGLAALSAAPDDILVVTPSDHYIPDVAAFRRVITAAAELAEKRDGIVCLGMKPTRPETGYGYICLGEPLDVGFRIASFVEKPPARRAKTLLDEGALWNGGIFVVRAGVYLDLVSRYLPELAEVLGRVRENGSNEAFAEAPSISVDHGILEKCDESFAVRADFPWDDVGDWGAMARIFERDEAGNAVNGTLVAQDAGNLIVDTDAGIVAAVGVSDVAIIRHRDVVLVVKRGEEQRVRELLPLLDRRGLGSYR